MKLIILSDIHANYQAFCSVLQDIKNRKIQKYKICILGDSINYSLEPNKTLDLIKKLQNDDLIKICIMGNHERALLGFDDDRFSEKRGKEILEVTKQIISEPNIQYIKENFSQNHIELTIKNKKYLFIHGSKKDIYWKSIDFNDLVLKDYENYDYVFSGHSHKPHFIELYTKSDNPLMRNKKKIVFINPGSVGQPRNHNKMSQYLIFDTSSEEMTFCKVSYDISKTQEDYSNYSVDSFYKDRLSYGV